MTSTATSAVTPVFTRSALLAACLALLVLAGCSNNTVAELRAIIVAGDAAVVILQANHSITPETASEALQYLSVAGSDVSLTATILASNETDARKALDIAAAFSNVPAVSPSIAIYVMATHDAIVAFLASYPAPKATILAESGPGKTFKISGTVRSQILAIGGSGQLLVYRCSRARAAKGLR